MMKISKKTRALNPISDYHIERKLKKNEDAIVVSDDFLDRFKKNWSNIGKN